MPLVWNGRRTSWELGRHLEMTKHETNSCRLGISFDPIADASGGYIGGTYTRTQQRADVYGYVRWSSREHGRADCIRRTLMYDLNSANFQGRRTGQPMPDELPMSIPVSYLQLRRAMISQHLPALFRSQNTCSGVRGGPETSCHGKSSFFHETALGANSQTMLLACVRFTQVVTFHGGGNMQVLANDGLNCRMQSLSRDPRRFPQIFRLTVLHDSPHFQFYHRYGIGVERRRTSMIVANTSAKIEATATVQSGLDVRVAYYATESPPQQMPSTAVCIQRSSKNDCAYCVVTLARMCWRDTQRIPEHLPSVSTVFDQLPPLYRIDRART
ncbi:hypothetical protein EK21DRAFT_87396 [Setomelanomma holmii]|uniref:Uncharacterized protein n=1 Tax=Setomelanomma holmii TaxID=210430 RepID=A0A9P4HCV6_9PLEO|nr:hypothetical protein EK21DRAFT_87396 [Setomelanomma holmii]